MVALLFLKKRNRSKILIYLSIFVGFGVEEGELLGDSVSLFHCFVVGLLGEGVFNNVRTVAHIFDRRAVLWDLCNQHVDELGEVVIDSLGISL